MSVIHQKKEMFSINHKRVHTLHQHSQYKDAGAFLIAPSRAGVLADMTILNQLVGLLLGMLIWCVTG